MEGIAMWTATYKHERVSKIPGRTIDQGYFAGEDTRLEA